MRFKGLDLNLLVAFDALVTQGNLTAAARSINLSQPAMSAAVARLRTYFRDELFTMRAGSLSQRRGLKRSQSRFARLSLTFSSPSFLRTASIRLNRIGDSGSSCPTS